MKKTKITIISIIIISFFIISAVIYSRSFQKSNIPTQTDQDDIALIEQPEDYNGTKGERVVLTNGEIKININGFEDNKARFFNIEMPSKKTVYFFAVQDNRGIYRAAANECQICYSAKKGFRQEGDEMVCNNCGNRYPIEKIATEKGGCNPAPINPDLKAVEGEVTITEAQLEEVSIFF